MKLELKAMVAAVALAAAFVPAAGFSQTAQTRQGKVQGIRQGGADAFLGLPYAAPPVGEARWRAPAPAAAWKGVRKADKFGASCEQGVGNGRGFGPWTTEYVVHGEVSEDCLSLNVWTPHKRPGAKLPVMVWIHGGGFSAGSGSVPIYDGANLAQRGIVVVSINYRLGLFGFLAHPELTKEAGASGNYGLMDMVAALRWVRDNISRFGGEPAKVTIAGQSAGAVAVHDLIAAPSAKGLFIRAIAQSGSGTGVGAPSLAAGEAAGITLAERVGAKSIADLRKVSPAALMAAAGGRDGGATAPPGLRFMPVVDGKVMPKDPETLARGEFNDTPVLTGLNADEGSGLSPTYGKATASGLKERLEKTFTAGTADARRFYAASTDAEAGSVSKALSRDWGQASAYRWAVDRTSKSANPVFFYFFTHPEPGPEVARYGAFHSSEIPYIFQTLDKSPDRGFTAEDRRISETMTSFWVNYIRSGNPNGGKLPQWPRFDARSPMVMELNAKPHLRPVLPADKLKLYNAYVDGGGKLSLF